MKVFRNAFFVVLFVTLYITLFYSTPAFTSQSKDPVRKLNQLRHQQDQLRQKASLINLINGLHLTQEQMKNIVQINQDFKSDLLERYEEGIRILKNANSVFENWIEHIKGNELPEDIMKTTQKADAQMKQLALFTQRLQFKHANRLDNVFTDAQRTIIDEFSPCIVPPQDLRDPVRAGQAQSAHPRLVEHMRFLRSLDRGSHRQRVAKERSVERAIEIMNRTAHLTASELEKETKRIRELIGRLISMSDLDFELNKSELIEEFVQGSASEKLKNLRSEMERIGSEMQEIGQARRLRHSDRITRFFLNPEMVIPVLNQRLQ